MAVIQVENWTLELPDKKYFTIGEVAQLCGLKAHVLRYWEKEFPMLRPAKRSGRRYYQHKDIRLVMEIKHLLHEQGFTIDGAVRRLSRRHRDVSTLKVDDGPLRQLQDAHRALRDYMAWLETQNPV
ncbi:MerR family transcriptional regulator [Sulfurivirga sp.]|uniref:MerR family transcriptional regulator n=1 Tax=Sulfurivirga sp. TaxID=2614236 RepID=UPI00345B89C6